MSSYEKYLKEGVFVGPGMDASEEEEKTSLSPLELVNLKILVMNLFGGDPKMTILLKRTIAKLENEQPLSWANAGPLLKILKGILGANTSKLKMLLK